MKLIGVAGVRNDADVVEAFVRHNLTVLDALLVVDHASTDGTEQILVSLVREGLPLVALRDEGPGEPSRDVVHGALARRAFAQHHADFVVPLAAGDFLKVPSSQAFETALAALAAGHHACLSSLAYVPDFSAEGNTLEAIRGAQRVALAHPAPPRVVVARDFALHRAAMIDADARMVRSPDHRTVAPHASLAEAVAAIARVPIRSRGQYEARAATRWITSLRATSPTQAPEYRLAQTIDDLRSGRTIAADELARVAANDGVPPEHWLAAGAPTRIDDPFLAPIELRYGQFATTDPLARVLQHVERAAALDATR